MSLAFALVPRAVPGRVGGGCLPCSGRVGAITLAELRAPDCGEPAVLAAALASLGATAEQAEAKLGHTRGNEAFCFGVALARDYHENDKLDVEAAWAKAKANVDAELDKLFPERTGWHLKSLSPTTRGILGGAAAFLAVVAMYAAVTALEAAAA